MVIYTTCYLIGRWVAGVNYGPQAIVRDLGLQMVAAYLAYYFFRRRWVFILVQFLILGFFFLSHAAKVSFHGVPVSPDDMYAITDLFWVLQKWQRALMLLYPVVVVTLLLYGVYWRRTLVALTAMGGNNLG